jgi:hypothetical protein
MVVSGLRKLSKLLKGAVVTQGKKYVKWTSQLVYRQTALEPP